MSVNREVQMQLLQSFYKLIDLFFRMRNRIRRLLYKKSLFSHSTFSSDSQATFYENAVSQIISNDNDFSRFRRKYDYREILEHVDYDFGKKYLNLILQKNPNVLLHLDEFQKNDQIGMPRTYNFPMVGTMSPTTLRYIAVAIEITEKLRKSKFSKIVEIGGGYGGQACILHTLDFFEEYYVYDLPNVQTLIEKFCSSRKIKNIFHLNFNEKYNYEFDLLISNYAFSELPREAQNQYITEAVLKSRNGFMIMNSGYRNQTGRSDGKFTLDELKQIIPNLEIHPEEPVTSPDNYLLVWRQPND